MVTMVTKKMQKNAKNYICEICHFEASNKYNFNKHLSTLKHKNNENGNNGNEKNAKKCLTNFICEFCNKSYNFNSGLSRHKKTCNNKLICYNIDKDCDENRLIKLEEDNNNLKENNKELKNLIEDLIKKNVKQHEQINELIPKIGNTTNYTINNNQQINIQVFLNEKCKDAINMSDFIKSIEINLEQLDFTNKKGLADGLSKSIIENMNKLSIYERPLHCTDIKREILYIKDDNVWEKDKSKEKIKNVIKKASSKNYNALKEWKKENPDFMNNENKTDYFTKTLSTIGKTSEIVDEKVIKNICKETYLKNIIN